MLELVARGLSNDEIADRMVIVDRRMRIVWMNTVAEGEVGPVVGRPCFEVLGDGAGECERCPAVRTFVGGHVERGVRTVRGVDGRTRYLDLISAPLRDDTGQVYQVLEVARDVTELVEMEERGIAYRHLSASRYAEGLRRHVRAQDPERLADILIIGAFIEARSCERFARLIPHLDDKLAKFYRTLVKSEGRHYEDYLMLAQHLSQAPIESRVAFFAERERELIASPDTVFRFHSGVPA